MSSATKMLYRVSDEAPPKLVVITAELSEGRAPAAIDNGGLIFAKRWPDDGRGVNYEFSGLQGKLSLAQQLLSDFDLSIEKWINEILDYLVHRPGGKSLCAGLSSLPESCDGIQESYVRYHEYNFQELPRGLDPTLGLGSVFGDAGDWKLAVWEPLYSDLDFVKVNIELIELALLNYQYKGKQLFSNALTGRLQANLKRMSVDEVSPVLLSHLWRISKVNPSLVIHHSKIASKIISSMKDGYLSW